MIATTLIGVPAEKSWLGNAVLPKFCELWPNHDF